MALQPEYTLPQELAANANLTHDLVNDQIFQNMLYILQGNFATWDDVNTDGALTLTTYRGKVMLSVRVNGNLSGEQLTFTIDGTDLDKRIRTLPANDDYSTYVIFPLFNLSNGLHTFEVAKKENDLTTNLTEFAVWEF